jgi:flagellar assembly factor FliW
MIDNGQPGTALAGAVKGLLGKEICFPAGLFGFPSQQRFKFKRFNPGDGSVSPFFILESIDGVLSFPLIHPDFVARDYRLEISPEMMSDLQAQTAADLLVMLIVTVRDRPDEITVNLQGPVLIHPTSRIGMQLVAEEYPVRYPLLAPAVP